MLYLIFIFNNKRGSARLNKDKSTITNKTRDTLLLRLPKRDQEEHKELRFQKDSQGDPKVLKRRIMMK